MTRSSRDNRSKVFRASCASSLTRPTINRDKGEQRCVGHVPSRDVHQPSWTTAQQMTVPEVAVLRDDDAILAISDLTDHLIGRRVTVGKSRALSRRIRATAVGRHAGAEAARRPAISRSTERYSLSPGSQRSEFQRGEKVVTFQILVVAQDLLESSQTTSVRAPSAPDNAAGGSPVVHGKYQDLM